MNRSFFQKSCFSRKSRSHSTEVIFFTSWKLQLEPWKMPWEMPWKMLVRKIMYWNLVFFFVFIFHAISHGIFHGIFHTAFFTAFFMARIAVCRGVEKASLVKRVISVKIMLWVKNVISVEKIGFLKHVSVQEFCAQAHSIPRVCEKSNEFTLLLLNAVVCLILRMLEVQLFPIIVFLAVFFFFSLCILWGLNQCDKCHENWSAQKLAQIHYTIHLQYKTLQISVFAQAP